MGSMQETNCFQVLGLHPSKCRREVLCSGDLVLSVAKNLQSFNNLQRYNGILYSTIHEACLAQGLLKDNGKWQCTLDKAKCLQTGFMLHALFIVILQDCIPTDPLALWHEYKSFICNDLDQLLPHLGFQNMSQSLIKDYRLHLIE
jgi:hypothetical protein